MDLSLLRAILLAVGSISRMALLSSPKTAFYKVEPHDISLYISDDG